MQVCMRMNSCMHVCLRTSVGVFVYGWVYAHTVTHMYLPLYAYASMLVCTYECIAVLMCACVHGGLSASLSYVSYSCRLSLSLLLVLGLCAHQFLLCIRLSLRLLSFSVCSLAIRLFFQLFVFHAISPSWEPSA